jgi:hypothetical protein
MTLGSIGFTSQCPIIDGTGKVVTMRVSLVGVALALVVGACGGGDVPAITTAAPTTVAATAAPSIATTSEPVTTTTTAAPTTVAPTATVAPTTTTGAPTGAPALPDTPVVGAFNAPVKWGDEVGEATIEELGFDPTGIEMHWYRDGFVERWIVVFVGLDLATTGTVCPTSSFFGDGAQGSKFFGTSPIPGANCDAAPAPLIDPAEGGVRVCDGVVSLLTLIPAETPGQLYGGLERYPDGGTFYAVGGSVVADQSAPFIDPATLDC